MSKPPVTATLTWRGDLRFTAASAGLEMALDGHSKAGPSPPQALAMALAGCMAVDVADIVVKGRHQLTAFETAISGWRADDPPRRFLRFAIHFRLRGDVPQHAVERAIQLSRDKYCSVWHSLQPDTILETTFEVTPDPSTRHQH